MPSRAGWRGKKVLSSGVAIYTAARPPTVGDANEVRSARSPARSKREHFGGWIVFLLPEMKRRGRQIAKWGQVV
jgi:hypothetical protein